MAGRGRGGAGEGRFKPLAGISSGPSSPPIHSPSMGIPSLWQSCPEGMHGRGQAGGPASVLGQGRREQGWLSVRPGVCRRAWAMTLVLAGSFFL